MEDIICFIEDIICFISGICVLWYIAIKSLPVCFMLLKSFFMVILSEIKSKFLVHYGNKKWHYSNLTKKEKKLVRRMFSANTKVDPRYLNHLTLEEIKNYHAFWSSEIKGYRGNKNKNINLRVLGL